MSSSLQLPGTFFPAALAAFPLFAGKQMSVDLPLRLACQKKLRLAAFRRRAGKAAAASGSAFKRFRVLQLLEPAEPHLPQDAVRHDDNARLALRVAVEMLVDRIGRDIDEVARLPFVPAGLGLSPR
jgi:hypothetical protein